jgi:hypothetical protein
MIANLNETSLLYFNIKNISKKGYYTYVCSNKQIIFILIYLFTLRINDTPLER